MRRRPMPSLARAAFIAGGALVAFGAPPVLHAQSPPASADTAGTLLLEAGTFQTHAGPIAVRHGTLTVPANRAAGSRAVIRVRFVLFPSTAIRPGPPIVFLAGGPGDSGVRAFQGIPQEFLAALRAVGDVVALDQRGTGLSEPRGLQCPITTPLPLDRPGGAEQYEAIMRERVTRCIVQLEERGIDVAGLTTAESADDLALLRRALGVDRIILLGGSYGTHLALATVKRHPDAIAAVLLAGVEGPDHTLKLPGTGERALARFDSARGATDSDGGPLAASIDRLAADLEREPVTVVLDDRAVVLGAWDLRRRVADALGRMPDLRALPGAIRLMEAGDYSELARWAIAFRNRPATDMLNIAMDCASGATADRVARIRATAGAAVLRDVADFPKPVVCDVPGLPRLDDAFRSPVVSDVPALLVSGRLDGRTPPENAEEVAAGFANAQILVIDDASHDVFGRPAVTDAMVAFLARYFPVRRY
jgi:pimeloyl-ACP methyl ester carboxylesterase